MESMTGYTFDLLPHSVSSERHRYKVSNVESQVFTPKISHARSGDRTQIAGMPSMRADHYITAPLCTVLYLEKGTPISFFIADLGLEYLKGPFKCYPLS